MARSIRAVLSWFLPWRQSSFLQSPANAVRFLGRFGPDNRAQKTVLPRLSTANLSAELHPG
jgi:hypothetical protein